MKIAKKSATDERPVTTNTDTRPAAQRITVKGRVVDPDGKPISGATVAASRSRKGGIGPYGWDADRQELDRTVSDASGRFP